MGIQQSKDELLYQQVNYGNIEGIKSLHQQGAGLEWIDKEGKTPLIAACLRHDLLPVAKVLIEMGAKVNAYRPGSHAGTPLHHAAKKGLEQTVNLLLSNGANPFTKNDDCHTALDLAREKGHCKIVRAIESRISIFSGWLREHYGPSFLEAFAPQLLSRKVWAVVLPCDSRNPTRPTKFELAIYSDLQMPRPRTVISLWKAKIEEPKLNQADPAVIIMETSTRSRYKLLSANEGDKRQLQWFYNACLGFVQSGSCIPNTAVAAGPIPPAMISNISTASIAAPTTIPEDIQLAMAINASIQTAIAEGVTDVLPSEQVDSTNGWQNSSGNSTYNGWGPSNSGTSNKLNQVPSATAPDTYNGWDMHDIRPNTNPQQTVVQTSNTAVVSSSQHAAPLPLHPSAPPLADETFYGPIHYPSIDSSPIDVNMAVAGSAPGTSQGKEAASEFEVSKPGTSGANEGSSNTSGCCAICLDAPVEGACIPCGHMAGCMSCLKEIEAKSRECPVCRAKIEKVIRLYAV